MKYLDYSFNQINKRNGKELSLLEMKNIIYNLLLSLTDDSNENYIKFYKFCSKLDEGGFTWHFGEPYAEEDFTGYHSNPNLIFHGFLARHKNHITLCRDGTYGYVPIDCNFTFYYIPPSQLKIIENLHEIVSPYYKFEEFLQTISKDLRQIIRHDPEYMDDNLRILVSDYMDSYLNLFIKLN